MCIYIYMYIYIYIYICIDIFGGNIIGVIKWDTSSLD